MYVIYLIVRVVQILLWALETAMCLRAVLSWFIMDEENGFMGFLCAITEPVILPVRILLEKLNLFQNTPVDISFLLTFLLLSFVSSFL